MALTLYGMVVVLIPAIAWLMVPWLRDGQRAAGARVRGPVVLFGAVLLAVFGVGLGTAIGGFAASANEPGIGPSPDP